MHDGGCSYDGHGRSIFSLRYITSSARTEYRSTSFSGILRDGEQEKCWQKKVQPWNITRSSKTLRVHDSQSYLGNHVENLFGYKS